MNSSTRPRRPPPSAAHRASAGLDPITPLDRRRYFDSRAGISPAELAARENVKLATIQRSLDKMAGHAANLSQESVEMATRQIYLDQLPSASHVFEEALSAVKMESKVITNPETGATDIIEVAVPDHATRLKAIEQLKSLLATTIPKQPMVAVDARTQINNQAGGGLPGHQNALSSEAIIRQIRAERNLNLGDGSGSIVHAGIAVPQDIDRELEDELAEDGEFDDLEPPSVEEFSEEV